MIYSPRVDPESVDRGLGTRGVYQISPRDRSKLIGQLVRFSTIKKYILDKTLWHCKAFAFISKLSTLMG